MLDLSSALGRLPFFALADQYYISEAPLCPILLFTFFTSSFFTVSMLHRQLEGLCCFGTVLPLDVFCLPTFSTFFCEGRHVCSSCLPYLPGHSFSLLSDFPLSLLFFSQAKRSQAVCPDPSVPVTVLAWRLWCAAVTSTSTHCPRASPEMSLNCEFLDIIYVNCICIIYICIYILSV